MNLKIKIRTTCIILFTTIFTGTFSAPFEEVRITVKGGERQEFLGYGSSIFTKWYSDDDIPQNVKDSIMKFMLVDCDFKYLGLGSGPAPEAPAECRWLWGCKESYGVVSDKSNDNCIDFIGDDIRRIYLAAKKYRNDLKIIRGTGYYLTQLGGFANWADYKSYQFKVLKEQYGVPSDYVAIANEPDVSMCGPDLSNIEIVSMVKELRNKLDENGMEETKIIGPQTCNAMSRAQGMVKAIMDDPEAWDALDGISTHSYNISITDEMEKLVENSILSGEKIYLQTESAYGPCRSEFAENAEIAADEMAKLLGDLNHLSQVWLQHRTPDIVNSEWVKSPDNSCNAWYFILIRENYNDILFLLKCYYLKQITKTIRAGAICRKAISHVRYVNESKYWRREDSTMVFAYGETAPLYLAAAVNPDGSWGIGVTNYTGYERNPYSIPRPLMNYRVKVKVEELVGKGNIKFAVHRCNAQKGDPSNPYIHPEDIVTMIDGEVIIDSLGQFDLITLRSAPKVSIHSPQRKADVLDNQLSIKQSQGSSNIIFRFTVADRKNAAVIPIRIYDLHGKEIISLVTDNISGTEYGSTWDRTGNDDQTVAAGMYMVRYRIGSNTQIMNFLLN